MKFCRYCSTHKPVTEFGVRRASRDGLSYKCRSCSSAYGKVAYKRAPDLYKTKARQWALANKSRRAKIVAKWESRNQGRINAWKRARYSANLEVSRADVRRRAFDRRISKNRRAGALTRKSVESALRWSNGYCVYCGLKSSKLTLDHVEPLSRRGANVISNILPCCASCNGRKHTKPAADWLYDNYGVEGLARALVFLERIRGHRPIPKRIFAALFHTGEAA